MIDHPNRYFDDSRYLRMGKQPIKMRTDTKDSPMEMETSVTEKVGTAGEGMEDFGDFDPNEFEDLEL